MYNFHSKGNFTEYVTNNTSYYYAQRNTQPHKSAKFPIIKNWDLLLHQILMCLFSNPPYTNNFPFHDDYEFKEWKILLPKFFFSFHIIDQQRVYKFWRKQGIFTIFKTMIFNLFRLNLSVRISLNNSKEICKEATYFWYRLLKVQ